MANAQVFYQGSSGLLGEFFLQTSLGSGISAATPFISYVKPKGTAVSRISPLEFYEINPTIASGHYLFRPPADAVAEFGTLTVYASGTGVVVGQASGVLLPSIVSTTYFDIIGDNGADLALDRTAGNYITGLPQKFTRTVMVGRGTKATQTVVQH